MSLLSGSDLRRARATHSWTSDIVIQRANGSKLYLEDLPPIIDGTVNFVDQGIRRRFNVTFETQSPSLPFLNTLDDDNAMWSISLDGEAQGEYYLRDFSIDNPGPNQNYRVYLQDESALIAERRTTDLEAYSGDLISVCEAILEASGRTLVFTGQRTLGIQVSVTLDVDKDRWAYVESLLDEYGFEILTDRDGGILIRPYPEQSIIAPDLTDIFLAEQSTHTRRSINHIVVISRLGNVVTRYESFDTDPTSPSWYYGTYGDVPKIVQIQGAGEEVLERLQNEYFGRKISRTFSMLQIPKVDLGDSYYVSGTLYKADKVSYSLVVGRPMYLTGRSRI